MRFRTPIEIEPSPLHLTYRDEIMSLGSCFSDNIGQRLADAFFNIHINPFGILFNPASIATSLHRILDTTPYSQDELVQHDGMWHSMSHHGCYSSPNASDALRNINTALCAAHEHLKHTNILLLTFGTAWVYEYNQQVVANCHKLPSHQFSRRRLRVEEITAQYATLIERVSTQYPHLNIILTVSPVRHLKDGLHENQLSKATLLLAIEQLCTQFQNVTYFPAYEIVMDELRDYRYYADDMTHPSQPTIQYIWERFCATYMDKDTQVLVEQAEQIRRKLQHRPLYPDSAQAKAFQAQAKAEAEQFQERINKQ